MTLKQSPLRHQKQNKSIACLRIPSFPWQVELMRNPKLADHSVIIAGTKLDFVKDFTSITPGVISDTNFKIKNSLSARIAVATSPDLNDVILGMPLTEATSRHSGVLIIDYDKPLYEQVFNAIIENLEDVIPDVESVAPGLAYAGIWGLEALYGNDAQIVRLIAETINGFNIRIGIADNKWLAYAASLLSRTNSGRKVTSEPGQFLDKFPVESLPIPYQLIKQFHAFGLTTMGHIADMPRGAVEAQFGKIGGTAWELSNGIDNRPLLTKKRLLKVSENIDFANPTVNMTTIVLAIENLLERAYESSQLNQRFARQATIQSHISEHAPWTMRVAFKDPIGNKNQALLAIKSKLNISKIPGPLENINLTLCGITGEGGQQESIWKEVKRDTDLHKTIRQLHSRLRITPPVYQIKELEPWSRIPERRYALVNLDDSTYKSELETLNKVG